MILVLSYKAVAVVPFTDATGTGVLSQIPALPPDRMGTPSICNNC